MSQEKIEGVGARFYFLISLLWFATTALFSAETDIPLPKAMASLGDSISEGMLSEFSLEDPPSHWQVLHLITLSMKEHRGDSEERIKAFRKVYAAPKHSWAAGEEESDLIESHAERLKVYNPDLKVSNFSISGARSKHLYKQTAALLEDEDRNQIHYDYIAMMMGANDVGTETVEEMTTPFQFIGNIEDNLRLLLNKNPDRRILILGLPQIEKIFQNSVDLVAYSLPFYKFKCAEIRDLIYGPLVLFHPENTSAYETARNILKLYRSGMENLVTQLQEDYPQAHIKTVQGYEAKMPIVKTLSIDCFHPSFWGQAQLAETSWKLGFWPQR